MGAEIGVGALLASAGLSSVGNIAGSAMSAAGAREANNQAMRFNAAEAEKNRNFQREMYNQQFQDQKSLYNEFQSPSAIAKQLQQIGVNAAGAFASGQSGFTGSMPSVPSGSSGSQASIGSLQNPMASYADALKGTTSDAVSVLNSITDKNLKDKQALKVLAEKAGQDVQNRILSWTDMINNTVGSEKAKQELNEIIVRIATFEAAGELDKAKKETEETIQRLNNKQFDLKDEEYQQLIIRGLYLTKSLDNEIALGKEKIKTEKSAQVANYGAAEASRAAAIASKAAAVLSEQKTEFQKLENALKGLEVQRNRELAVDILQNMRSELQKSKSLNRKEQAEADKEFQKLQVRLQHYDEYENAAAFDEFFDNFPIIKQIFK